MRFLAYACIPRGVVERLRSNGHDAAHLSEQGLQKLPDQEERLQKVLAESASELEQSVVISVEPSRHRVRAFPLRPGGD